MILYICHLKYSSKSLADLITNFCNAEGYKLNIQKSIAFLYTNNEYNEREIRETKTFIKTSPKMKYLGINLTKKVKDLCSENYGTLTKVIEEDLRKWKNISCSWITKSMGKWLYP